MVEARTVNSMLGCMKYTKPEPAWDDDFTRELIRNRDSYVPRPPVNKSSTLTQALKRQRDRMEARLDGKADRVCYLLEQFGRWSLLNGCLKGWEEVTATNSRRSGSDKQEADLEYGGKRATALQNAERPQEFQWTDQGAEVLHRLQAQRDCVPSKIEDDTVPLMALDKRNIDGLRRVQRRWKELTAWEESEEAPREEEAAAAAASVSFRAELPRTAPFYRTAVDVDPPSLTDKRAKEFCTSELSNGSEAGTRPLVDVREQHAFDQREFFWRSETSIERSSQCEEDRSEGGSLGKYGGVRGKNGSTRLKQSKRRFIDNGAPEPGGDVFNMKGRVCDKAESPPSLIEPQRQVESELRMIGKLGFIGAGVLSALFILGKIHHKA